MSDFYIRAINRERKRHAENQSVLKAGAVYYGDNGRAICRTCAGASAALTGRDISGQKVERLTLEDVAGLQSLGYVAACEMACTVLSDIAGPDGFPAGETVGRDEARDRRKIAGWNRR